jgi:hypothetical protein
MQKPLEQKLPIGTLLVQEGLLTEEQLAQGLAAQKASSPGLPLGRICVDLGFLSPTQLGTVLSKHHERLLLGELLEHLGLITPDQLQEALTHQKRHAPKKKLGAILVEQGKIDEKVLVRTLYRQVALMPQLAAATKKAQAKQCALETILIEDYKVSRKEIGYALSVFYQCQFIFYSDKRTIPLHLVAGLNQSYLKASCWVPLKSTDDSMIPMRFKNCKTFDGSFQARPFLMPLAYVRISSSLLNPLICNGRTR